MEENISFTDIVQLMGGGTPKTDEPDYWDGEIPFFTPKDVSDSPFCIATEKNLTQSGLDCCSSKAVSTTHNICNLPWNCRESVNGWYPDGDESILLCA